MAPDGVELFQSSPGFECSLDHINVHTVFKNFCSNEKITLNLHRNTFWTIDLFVSPCLAASLCLSLPASLPSSLFSFLSLSFFLVLKIPINLKKCRYQLPYYFSRLKHVFLWWKTCGRWKPVLERAADMGLLKWSGKSATGVWAALWSIDFMFGAEVLMWVVIK